MTNLTEKISRFVKKFRWERTGPHTRKVCLGNAKYPVNVGWADAGSRNGTAGSAVGRRYKRIRTVIDIKHRCLGALEKNVLSCLKLLIQKQRRFDDIGTQAIRIRQIRLADLLDRIGGHSVYQLENGVCVFKCGVKLLTEDLLVKHVLHTQTRTIHLIHIRRAHTALGGADKILAKLLLVSSVQIFVIWHHDVGITGNLQRIARNTLCLQHVYLTQENFGINNTTVANNGIGILIHNARRYLMKRKLSVSGNNRMSCVCTTGIPAHNVKISGNKIGNFTFSFVAPLSAHKNGS